MGLTADEEYQLNTFFGPMAQKLQLGSKLKGAGSENFNTIAFVSGYTVDNDNNVAGLASAILLANAMKATYNGHIADDAEHAAEDDVNVVTAANASDLASLLALTADLLTQYAAHNADAVAGSPTFHQAQQAGNTLVSAVAPTTLAEAVTRLNDLKAKYNTHDGSSTSHDTGSLHQEATANAAFGAAVDVPSADVKTGDVVMWKIEDDGTNNVTKVGALAQNGSVRFTFSGDPAYDTVISYTVGRANP